MVPSSSTQKKQYAKPPDWIRHKPTIKRLYLDLGWTLEKVQSYMEDQHQFYATKSMYKKRLQVWQFVKNSKRDVQPMRPQQDIRKDIPLRLAVNDASPTSSGSPWGMFTAPPRAPSLSDLQRTVAALQLYYRASLYAVDTPHGDWQRLVLGTGTAEDSHTVHEKVLRLLRINDTFLFVAELIRTRGCPSLIQMLQPLFDNLRWAVTSHNPETIICLLRLLQGIRLRQQSGLACILKGYVSEMSSTVLGKSHQFSVIWRQLSRYTRDEMAEVEKHLLSAASFEWRCALNGDGTPSATPFDSMLDEYVLRWENVVTRARTWLDIYRCCRAARSEKAAPGTPASSALRVALEHFIAGRFADAEASIQIVCRETDSGNAPDLPPLILTWTLAGLGFVMLDTGNLESAANLFRLSILNSERAGEIAEKDTTQLALQFVLDRQKSSQHGSAKYPSGFAMGTLEVGAKHYDVGTKAHLFATLKGALYRSP
ncbi:hypothetical protein DL764_001308 [Monosporascus ibericus]|uniref:Clr5 domain-containing protein n=1 Tax=Monosporascus ibericus TaxID=155417 RepID=A0A4V1XCE1_9PEZI|nr:hypothetical protein DL764_001308 [Monosporascus ibericus]